MERRKAAVRAGSDRPRLEWVGSAARRELSWLPDKGTPAKEFKADPAGLVTEAIRGYGERITTTRLKAALEKLGLTRSAIDAVWPAVRGALQQDSAVSVDRQWYAWRAPEPVEELARLTPADALARLAERDSLPLAVRQALVAAVQAGLGAGPTSPASDGSPASDDTPATDGTPATSGRPTEAQPTEPQPTNAQPTAAGQPAPPAGPGDAAVEELNRLRAEKARLEAMLRDTHHQQTSFRAAQDRQLKIDSIRTLAEMAIEVEELAANGAEPDVIIERVRTLAEISELEPIGQVGQPTTYDPARHRPLAGQPDAGSEVSVVRPGYTWHADDDDVLLEKAIVG